MLVERSGAFAEEQEPHKICPATGKEAWTWPGNNELPQLMVTYTEATAYNQQLCIFHSSFDIGTQVARTDIDERSWSHNRTPTGSITGQYVVRNLLGQHVHTGLWMSRREERKRRCIYDAESADAIDASLGVDDGHGVIPCSHLARRRRMIYRTETLLDKAQDLLVSIDGGTGKILGSDGDVRHVSPDLSYALERRDSKIFVLRRSEPVRIDHRWYSCVW